MKPRHSVIALAAGDPGGPNTLLFTVGLNREADSLFETLSPNG
jgi:hypothetical protein